VPDRRLAFVAPRYGPDVVGGSEALSREAAHGFAARGYSVDVLTTCARNHYTWENEYDPGEAIDGAVTVRRFRVVRDPHRELHERVERRIQTGERPSLADQYLWANGLFRVPDLFHHLVVTSDSYDAVILSPYLFWTTLAGAGVAPDRTVVIPCLHDEHYAYLDVVRPVLRDPAAVWFLSEPEHDLAHHLSPLAHRHDVTGCGVDVPAAYDPERFRAEHGLRRPFVLYAGRREGGKGWVWLMHAFASAVRRLDLPFDLVTMGVGDVDPPAEIADRVVDLGFLDDVAAASAFAAADVYVQPSQMESFSRTIMESWLAGTAVIANAASAVVAWHCERSGAGITYRDEFEFARSLEFVADAPKVAAGMAARGRDYVLEHYTWPVVLDRMEAALAPVLETRR
jgi:glycosyltransferase involved in cell wall biosynthesis